jgi:coproporphyrinogen III oxidase-like Fe-S oxidoreductase
MLGMRTKRGLDVCEIGKMCGEKCGEFAQYIDLLGKLEYLRSHEGRIFLTTEGMIRSNSIISGFWDLLS